MGLRFRVNLAISLIGIIFVAAVAYILIDYKRRSINEEIDAGTRVTIQLLESIAINPATFQQGEDPLAGFVQYLRSVGRVRANEVRLFDNNNVLIYESPPSEYKQGRDAPQWFSKLVAPGTPEVRLILPVGSILVTPDFSRSVLDAWDELSRYGLLIIVFFLILNYAVFRMLGRSLEPLQGILAAMSEMERGKLTSRLPNYDLPEFDAISHTFNRMAATLEEALSQNARLALIAQQSSDAIMIRDLDGIISFCNPAVERLFGFSVEEMVGSSADTIVAQDCASQLAQIQTRVVNNKSIEHLETRLRTKENKPLEVAISIAPLIDPGSNEVIGEIYAIRDMTEHKQRMAAELELQQSRKFTQLIQVKLEEERKTIARELHDELGQCVTAIRTIGTAITNRTTEASETRQNAETIVEVATHIYDVVHSIIKQLRPSALDHLGLSDAITEIVERYRRQNPQLTIGLNLDGDLNRFDEKINITVYRVVQECLTNAVKHAEASEVMVEVALTQSENSQERLEIRVADNGRGLGPEFTEGGRFGLLGIRERVQAFGGELVVDSDPAQGTSILAMLPGGSS
ncbi:MAG: PAS domain S-box protein [Gammaproteobacteria bacterium]|nr:PAS domain S-box protein [Gammaproteobacteria bacterium]